MGTDSDSLASNGWVEKATTFLKHGYEIVPLEPTSGVSKDLDDPVVQQLGAEPLVHRVVGAASTEAEVKKLGEHFETAKIGARTGEESNLLAVELNKAGGWEESPFYERIASFTEGISGVTSTTREYIFFPYPNVEESLPELTEKKGVVLHGQDSLIPLPGGIYDWRTLSLDEGDTVFWKEKRRRARQIVELFGLGDHLSPEEDSTPSETEKDASAKRSEDAPKEESQLNLPLNGKPTNGHSAQADADSLFRSGDGLRLSNDRKNGRLNIPWTVPGGLSVLTGRPKTAGKSSWVLNLALHLSAGAPFFGYENSPSDVVLLADTSPANLRELLAQVDFGERDEALSRLHVLHPEDVVRLDWQATLRRTYDHAHAIGADLVIVDCLDRYVRLKGGHDPTDSEEVIHKLTAESPPDCPVLSVKSSDCTPEESLSATIDRLGLLGVSADAILRLDDISTEMFPCLRRLVTVSRRGTVSRTHFCSLRSGRYVRVRKEDISGRSAQEILSEPARPKSLAGGSSGSDPLLTS